VPLGAQRALRRMLRTCPLTNQKYYFFRGLQKNVRVVKVLTPQYTVSLSGFVYFFRVWL
jgi:hypothetical protein